MMDAGIVVLVLLVLLAALSGWFVVQLAGQNGRLLLRVEELERRVEALAAADAAPQGLPLRTVGIDLDLPNLHGGRMTLSHWRGRRLLLLFIKPECPFSRAMLPGLASASLDGVDGRPLPLILTTGEADENRRLLRMYGVRAPVLLQDDWEVAMLYRVNATPMGYLIDENGATMSELAAGPEPLLSLLMWPADARGPVSVASDLRRTTPRPADPEDELEEEAAEGLSEGDVAPLFRLPRIDGGVLALEEYRGRRLLLVFSDSACEACQELAPRLERRYRATPDPQVVMISRRSRELNQAMVAEHGLSFPVVLQRLWDTSRDYGIVATPVAYLVDEQGLIASNAAVGTAAILELDGVRPTGKKGEHLYGHEKPGKAF